MELNSSVIPHYTCKEIPVSELKKEVSINESYLSEKPTWYYVDNKLVYFKKRSDYRLFTEQFFSMFANEIVGLDTVIYKVANIRKVKCTSELEKKGYTGLISENFQDKSKYNYYLLSELENPSISSLVGYGDYCLSNLLEFFNNVLDDKSLEDVKSFLLKLFIADAFTLQMDRNHHNIGFKTPKIDGIDYSKRLRPEIISNVCNINENIVLVNGIYKLKNFSPTPVYDSERIFGVDHRNVFLHKENDVWTPIFPYSSDLMFRNQAEAKEAQDSLYDGLDPNLMEVFMNYESDVRDLIDRLANGDEYREILERFEQSNTQILLHQSTIEYFEKILSERRKVFQKVLKYS